MENKKLLIVVALLFVQGMAAQSGFAEDHRSHGAHVHGVGKLQVAIDNQTLSIGLESPAINIVGFEHHPGNTEEKKTVRDAKKILWDSSLLFGLPVAAQCQVVDTKVDFELIEDESDHEAEEHGHEAEEHEEESRHSEILASYTFRCEKPNALTHLDIHLFRHFPATEELETQFITSKGQGVAELTPDTPRLTF